MSDRAGLGEGENATAEQFFDGYEDGIGDSPESIDDEIENRS